MQSISWTHTKNSMDIGSFPFTHEIIISRLLSDEITSDMHPLSMREPAYIITPLGSATSSIPVS